MGHTAEQVYKEIMKELEPSASTIVYDRMDVVKREKEKQK